MPPGARFRFNSSMDFEWHVSSSDCWSETAARWLRTPGSRRSQPGIRTGRWLNPRTKEDRIRVGAPTTSILSKRRNSSSQRIFS